MSRLGYTELSNRSLILMRGQDRISFLQNIVTCNLENIEENHTAYGALLTPQGKFLFDFFLLYAENDLWLDTETARRDDLKKRLNLYKLRADVKISEPPDCHVYAGFGEDILARFQLDGPDTNMQTFNQVIVYKDPRLPAAGVRAIGPADAVTALFQSQGIPDTSMAHYDVHRLQLGLPDGSRDIQVEKSTILEANFESLNGVDFKKGCYVGQEVTARTKYRGLLRRRLLPVHIQGPAPPDGTDIEWAGRNAGTLRSHQDSIGMALIRLEPWKNAQAQGETLLAGQAEIQPFYPDWLPADGSQESS